MAGRIVVMRESGTSAWSARFAVRVDGRRVGRLATFSWQAFDVEPGPHRVRVTQLGVTSKTLAVTVSEGETVVLRTRIRLWINMLSAMAGALIGGPGFWLIADGPTAARLIPFGIGVAGTVTLMASKRIISLLADPAS